MVDRCSRRRPTWRASRRTRSRCRRDGRRWRAPARARAIGGHRAELLRLARTVATAVRKLRSDRGSDRSSLPAGRPASRRRRPAPARRTTWTGEAEPGALLEMALEGAGPVGEAEPAATGRRIRFVPSSRRSGTSVTPSKGSSTPMPRASGRSAWATVTTSTPSGARLATPASTAPFRPRPGSQTTSAPSPRAQSATSGSSQTTATGSGADARRTPARHRLDEGAPLGVGRARRRAAAWRRRRTSPAPAPRRARAVVSPVGRQGGALERGRLHRPSVGGSPNRPGSAGARSGIPGTGKVGRRLGGRGAERCAWSGQGPGAPRSAALLARRSPTVLWARSAELAAAINARALATTVTCRAWRSRTGLDGHHGARRGGRRARRWSSWPCPRTGSAASSSAWRRSSVADVAVVSLTKGIEAGHQPPDVRDRARGAARRTRSAC